MNKESKNCYCGQNQAYSACCEPFHEGKEKPDTANWEGKYDIEKIRMTGFIAQDVEKATKETSYDFSGLIKPRNEKDLYSLRYSDFVVPLVKASQELSQQNISLQRTVVAQQKQIDEQNRKIDRLTREMEMVLGKMK